MTPKPESFFTRILFKYHGEKKREICYIYNRQDLDDLLNIKRQEWDNSQFISIGDTVILEGHKCKVIEINFKLEEGLNKMESGYGVNMLSPSEPTDYNCQIGVFVERVD